MSVLIAVLIIGFLLTVWKMRQKPPKSSGRKVIPINSPSRGKFLRKLEAKARRDFPGRTENWYRQKADQDFKRYRKQ